MRTPEPEPKILYFASSARDELLAMPQEVRREFGHALWMIQNGETPGNASPFEGSHANDVMKLVERFEGDAYRAVYAVKFEHAVYVLHVFKKKSTSGIRTPQKSLKLVYERLQRAQEDYEMRFGTGEVSSQGSRKGKKR